MPIRRKPTKAKSFRPPAVKPVTKIKRATYGGSGKTNSQSWRTLSDSVKLRDNHTCQKCGRHKSELEPGECLETDHIRPVSRGGTDSKANMHTLCSKCHKKRPNHSHLDKKYREKTRKK